MGTCPPQALHRFGPVRDQRVAKGVATWGNSVTPTCPASRHTPHTTPTHPPFAWCRGVLNWKKNVFSITFFFRTFRCLARVSTFPTRVARPVCPFATVVGCVHCGWQVGPAEENELILTAVLDALHETLLILLRGQVKIIPASVRVPLSCFDAAMCMCSRVWWLVAT